MLIVANGVPLPATVSGANANSATVVSQQLPWQLAQLWPTTLYAPGTNRLDGTQTTVRATGNISAGVSSNAQLGLYLNYPTLTSGALQYPVANITNAVGNTTGGHNVALFNANNNFVIGQYVTVAGTANGLNGIVGPLIVANSTAFAGLVNTANVGNVAAANYTGTATVGPQPLYQGGNATPLNVNTAMPWMMEVRLMGDQQSGLLTCFGNDTQVNYNVVSAGVGPAQVNFWQVIQSTGNVSAVPGINYKLEPPFTLQAGVTWGTSNSNNTASLKQFFLED